MREPAGKEIVVDATRRWLEKVVIGLNLCPFAVSPWRQGRIRFRVSEANHPQQLAQDLVDELLALQACDPDECETTLLIHPHTLKGFLDYNDFLEIADRLLEDLGLTGTIQVASFHPDYRFADSEPDDPANCTNRSPEPMLHLLREASIEAATATMAHPEAIYERNIRTMQGLGMDAWKKLMARAIIDPEAT